jgi:FixJ family two-component response regulator
MQSDQTTIYLVDDNATVRSVLTVALSKAGYRVVCFADGIGLLAASHSAPPACVLLDVYLRDSFGLDILERLNAATYPAPVLLMSGRGNIATAVDAMALGAYDFLEKPFSSKELLARIQRARQRFVRKFPTFASVADFEPLSMRERDVLTLWISGETSKQIARQLTISHRTVELHRSKIMKKLRANNSAQVVQIALSNRAALGIAIN